MTTRFDRLSVGEFYHVYNRGTDKRTIFQDSSDYYRFVELLFLSNMSKAVNIRDVRKEFDSVFEFERDEPLVHIGAYCLMPNHFHILLTPAVESGIQTFMLKISTGYSMYFNKRYERTGGLFEGRFKSQHADSDEYLKYLFSYIHLNPLKLIQSDWKERGLKNISGGEKYLNKYPFSSYLDFTTEARNESAILNTKMFPEYFPDAGSFQEEIQEWMNYRSLFQEKKNKG